MVSECFRFTDEFEAADKIMNEGSILCIILACLMATLLLYGIYADGKKTVSNLKKVQGNQTNNIFVAAEEFKEFDDSIDHNDPEVHS